MKLPLGFMIPDLF
jgi:hypothetical protein